MSTADREASPKRWRPFGLRRDQGTGRFLVARFFTEFGFRAGSARSLTGQIEATAKRSWG